MTLTLRIDNFNQLPDGGPVSYATDQQGFEIGRDQEMDWTLPDPNRFVSSCHIEIRYENGGYWLYDVSTNGTFVNGGTMRVKSPYQLQQGDKIQIGHYIVVADLDGSAGHAAAQPAEPQYTTAAPQSGSPFASFGDESAAAQTSGQSGGGDIWSLGGAAPPAHDNFDPTPPPPRQPDFGDQHISFDTGQPQQPAPPQQPAQQPQAAPPTPAQDDGGDSPFGAPPPQTAPTPEPPAQAPAPEPPAPQPEADSPFGAPSAPEPTPEPQPQQPVATPQSSAFGSPPSSGPPPVPEGMPVPPDPAAPPAAGPAPAAPTPPAEAKGEGAEVIIQAFCEGAGLDRDALAGTDAYQTAHEIGRAMRIMTAELAGLLRVRTKTKVSMRSGSRTELGNTANNPLKFVPSAEESLEVMFGKGRAGFQRGPDAVQDGFDDIKKHQFAIYASIQPALAELLEDLAPEAIEQKVEGGRFSSKHAKAWEIFLERWDAKTEPYENGMLDVFNIYFAKAYDEKVNN